MKHDNKKMLPPIRLGILILCFTLMSCKSTLDVNGDFPSPVINQIPLSIGLIFVPEFSNYQYIETGNDRSEWEISVGTAQVQLFNVVFDAMFTEVSRVQNMQLITGKPVDLFFQPRLDSFQYNMPSETKGKMFEVWLKYNLKIFDSQQKLIADWVLTAYGKTPTAFLKSQEEALNDAMVIALRDLGASISLRFSQVPEINRWLKDNQQVLQASRPVQRSNVHHIL